MIKQIAIEICSFFEISLNSIQTVNTVPSMSADDYSLSDSLCHALFSKFLKI